PGGNGGLRVSGSVSQTGGTGGRRPLRESDRETALPLGIPRGFLPQGAAGIGRGPGPGVCTIRRSYVNGQRRDQANDLRSSRAAPYCSDRSVAAFLENSVVVAQPTEAL